MKNWILKLRILLLILFLSNLLAESQSGKISERQTVLDEIIKRPGDFWPRCDGHAVLAEPGSPLAQKGYHEPGGSFSPSPGSFGIAIWIMDKSNKVIATSDNIPVERITQKYIWEGVSRIPSIKTETPYYQCIWRYKDKGSWQFDLTKADIAAYRVFLVFRSTGPAGGAMTSVTWDKTMLVINRRWKVVPDVPPKNLFLGDEEKGQLTVDTPENQSVLSQPGWAFARMEINSSSFSVSISDSKPLFESPLRYGKTLPKFKFDVPDERFKESLNAQIANLMMGYIGRQTGPGEPVNYPLAWERDGAYSLMAMARSGNLETARDLSAYFAENDFFGGFGAEADAPGSEINALAEVAFLIDEPEYYKWLWPHIQRKLGYIDEMMNATDSVFKNFIGPLVPYLTDNLKRRQLICLKQENGLIYGAMDHHFPVLYVNAVSYRGLMQASRLAQKLGKKEIAGQCEKRASAIRSAWYKGFGEAKYNNERTYMISVWPTWITNRKDTVFLHKIESLRKAQWKNGAPSERPLWTYFTVSEAHQWLFLNRPDLVWETLEYFWKNQCSPGLFTYWEGNGEENSFNGWDQYRGWVKPRYVTPHYWTASEMVHLQLDMLAFYDESGDSPVLVIGGGVPESWTAKDISMDSYKTRYGIVSWSYKKNVMKVLLKGFRIKPEVRLGSSFGKNTELTVEYN